MLKSIKILILKNPDKFIRIVLKIISVVLLLSIINFLIDLINTFLVIDFKTFKYSNVRVFLFTLEFIIYLIIVPVSAIQLWKLKQKGRFLSSIAILYFITITFL